MKRVQMMLLRKKQEGKSQCMKYLLDMFLVESVRSAVHGSETAILANGHLIDSPVSSEEKAIQGIGLANLQFLGTKKNASVFLETWHTDLQIDLLICMLDFVACKFLEKSVI